MSLGAEPLTAPEPLAVTQTPRPNWIELNLRAMWGRAFVRFLGAVREPMWIVSDGVLPALAMCAYVLLYRALDAPPEYEAIVVLGGIISVYWLNVLWSMGAQLYWEKQQGLLALLFAAPCTRMTILTGMALGGLVMTTTRALIAIAVGFGILGVQVEPFSVWLLAAVFLIAMAALYSLGMMFASLFLLYGREAWHICNALQEPVYFLSGLYFPLSALGTFGAVAAGIVPLALAVDAMRQVLLGEKAHGIFPLQTEIMALAVLAVVLFFLARLSMRHLERLGKREGRLTQRWQ
jgi:ABC-2 type transport system permease protein